MYNAMFVITEIAMVRAGSQPPVGATSVQQVDLTGVGFGSSRKVTMPACTTVEQERVEKQLRRLSKKKEEFRSPLQQLEDNKYGFDKNSALLLVDLVGSNIKTDPSIKVHCSPSATVNSLCNEIRLGDVEFGLPHIIVLVGTNQVADFNCKIIIAQSIALLHAICDKTTAKIWLCGLLPRNIDHDKTSQIVTNFSHALSTAVGVVSHKRQGVFNFLSLQQLFLDEGGQCINKYFVKNDLHLSKSGIRRLKAHWLIKLKLTH